MKTTRFILMVTTLVVTLMCSLGCSEQDASTKADGSAARETPGGPLEERIRQILNEPGRLDRVEALIAELREVPASESDSFRDMLRNSKMRFRELERVLITARWAELDPIAASDHAINGENGTARSAAMDEAVQAWARIDPEAIVQSYDVQTIAKGTPALLTALVTGWYDSDVDGLEDYVFTIADPDLRKKAIAALARVVVLREGGEAAVEWATNLRRYKKNELFQEVGASIVTEDDPQIAVEFCREVCGTGPGTLVTQEIARAWGRRDGASMMDWLVTQPDIQDNWVAARIGYREFIIDDEEGAYEWLENNTTPEDRVNIKILDGPVQMYVNKLAYREPEKAIEWSNFIADELTQRNAKIAIVRRWRARDPEAAAAWVEQSDMNENDRTQAAKEAPWEKRQKQRAAAQAAQAAGADD
jgi:hypothetical protein